jgi:hypothetical protein
MTWAEPRLAASGHPATPSFPHQPVSTVAANPFQFIVLHTLSSDGNSLLPSFQQLTHSFPSHGTRHPSSPRFELPISAKSCIYRTYKKLARNFFICRTYKNKGLITPLFAAHTKNAGVSPISCQFGTRADSRRRDVQNVSDPPSYKSSPSISYNGTSLRNPRVADETTSSRPSRI